MWVVARVIRAPTVEVFKGNAALKGKTKAASHLD